MQSTYTRCLSDEEFSMTSGHRYVYMDRRTINPLLLCCICKEPFIDPVTTEDRRCGCRLCFTDQDGTLTNITDFIVTEMLNSLLVQCTQCGQSNIRRDALEKHEQTACKRAVTPCKASDIKCSWNGPRDQLKEHLSTCIFEPLRPALAGIMMENKQLRDKIEQLERRIDEMQNTS